MPNPLSSIIPVLDLLGENLKILPATGGAVEDLQHPDQEEIEDVVINREVEEITAFAETPEPNISNIYRSTPPLFRREKHLFRFLLMGVFAPTFLLQELRDEGLFPLSWHKSVLPWLEEVMMVESKLTHTHRESCCYFRSKIRAFQTPYGIKSQGLKKPDFFEIVDFTLSDVLSDAKKDPRDKAGAKARSEMHKLEIELIKSTDSFRDQNNWLILDGSVKFVEEDIWNSWKTEQGPCLIGVAKSFQKNPMFQFGRRSSQRKDITSILAGLPHAHRTAAFSAYGGQVAFWYVRLREQRELDYPLMGVIKVELPCPDQAPVPTELADLISRALVAERNVTPYGLDRRWHCSLYPIHIAEQVIKSRFFSKGVLMGCIKWPKPQIGGAV
jgi:hypothetical protein